MVKKFYARYADLLKKTSLYSFDDVVHEILLSVSKTDLSNVENMQNYILRAIKLRCWSILDKAVKLKEMQIEPILHDDLHNENDNTSPIPVSLHESGFEVIHEMELFGFINLFKSQLETGDRTLLNQLIDGYDRGEIAEMRGSNINTVDTHIRRLRIRLAEYLGSLGYSYPVLRRFES